MKKIIAMIAVAMAAIAGNAASVSWANTKNSAIVGLDGNALSVAAASANQFSISLFLVGGDSPVATVSAINNMSAGVMSGDGITWTYTYGEHASSGSAFYAKAFMTVEGQQYEMLIDQEWKITTAGDNTGKDTFAWEAGTYGGLNVAGNKATWTSVPEPTSGLLLVMGLAGLALRRKQA